MTSIQQIASDVATFAPSSGYLKILQNLEIGREDRQNEVLSQQRSRHCSAPTRTLQTTAAKLGSVPRLFCLRFHRRTSIPRRRSSIRVPVEV